MEEQDRRKFLKTMAAAGVVVVLPLSTSCGGGEHEHHDHDGHDHPADGDPAPEAVVEADAPAPAEVPRAEPADWDPIAFNRTRGNAGAIPETYLDDINGPEGEAKHLGKHLPYLPALEGVTVPAGMVALMWGDPTLDHARHPNAPKDHPDYPRGHWYDWIRIRKATDAEAEEAESLFSSWPARGEGDSGDYAVLGGGEITANAGRETIYLARLPADAEPGDTVRVHAHCLYHGEYVDFLELPAE